ncbi:MAG: AAA family ATPase [Desulfobulbaceae bacterium]|jgi:uncharacterized protein YhaN|nr:AAA family ATPase [Desulfobulbaceae bacterium]
MKILRLDLLAYGHFDKRESLDFSGPTPGLHIVYGRNEAGKSTTLRAVKALLYGFPQRTADNFLHPNDQLLLGGCLADETGDKLEFLRRKGMKETLRATDGQPIPDSVLDKFLLGVDEKIFDNLYAIDHERLSQGGQDILDQKGDLGQALFAAGSGLRALNHIGDSLRDEAAALFKKTGKNPEINRKSAEYREKKQELRKVSLAAAGWLELRDRLHGLEEERGALEATLLERRAQLQRLSCLSRALPDMELSEEIGERLASLTVQLPVALRDKPPDAGFAAEARSLREQIRESDREISQLRERLANLEAAAQKLVVSDRILRREKPIEELWQRLGEYHKGQKDRPRLEGERLAGRREAMAALARIRPDLSFDQLDELRRLRGRRQGIILLCQEYQEISSRLMQANDNEWQASGQRRRLQAEIDGQEPVVVPLVLEQLIKKARESGDIDQELARREARIAAAGREIRQELDGLRLWSGNWRELPSLPLPMAESLRRFAQKTAEREQDRRANREDNRRLRAEARRLAGERQKLLVDGALIAPDDLSAARERRDRLWPLLRPRLTSTTAEVVTPERVAQYEHEVALTDRLADQLRDDAERVARDAELRLAAARCEREIEENERHFKEINASSEKFDEDWRTLWQPLALTPLSPDEMIAWLTIMDGLRRRARQLLVEESERDERRLLRDELRQALDVAMLPTRESDQQKRNAALAASLSVAEAFVAEITRKNQVIAEKASALALAIEQEQKAGEEAKRLQERLADWQKRWRIHSLGLAPAGEDVEPADVPAVIEQIGAILDKEREVAGWQSRIEGIDRDAELFVEDVKRLMAAIDLDAGDDSVAAMVERGRRQLERNRQNARALAENQAERGRLAALLAELEARHGDLRARLDELNRQALCRDDDELTDVLCLCEQRAALEERLRVATESFARAREGLSIEEIGALRRVVPAAELSARIENLRQEISRELEPRRGRILVAIGECQKEFREMDGSGRAAEIAEELCEIEAEIVRLANHCAQLHLAAAFLHQAVERYRREHQNPLLQDASRIFDCLTLGSFTGLVADFGGDGRAALFAVQKNGRRTRVEAMSAGTRDQLYLSLRLSTLRQRQVDRRPFPFIVDDILINFDDRRAAAGLAVLAELGRVNQVILFTHHERIVHEAEQNAALDRIVIHRL